MKILVVLSVLLTVSSAKILTRCEFARIVKNSILSNFTSQNMNDWMCLAFYESQYDTLALRYNQPSDGKIGSENFGIFQINSSWWCDSWRFANSPNYCHISCNEFLQDNKNLVSNTLCAAVIVNRQGMEAWSSWIKKCKGKFLGHFTESCF
ncbi:lysozyme C-1/C-2-like [Rhincodon typus]|uniref:lysozyme C-1/C-2-like n=1 Tax=Rhincodon typus TaxID=259920 RepID=UPI002030236A|nr:lysozyme C-1/C-2-like [Rhincodon typus]